MCLEVDASKNLVEEFDLLGDNGQWQRSFSSNSLIEIPYSHIVDSSIFRYGDGSRSSLILCSMLA